MATDLSTVEVDRLLKEGQAAARGGDMATARTLLTQVVERDPHNERAWMWLSGVVAEPEEQQICLENVLVINPHNTKARKGLEYISAKTGISPNVSAPPTPPPGRAPKYTAPLSSDFSVFGDTLVPVPTTSQWSSAPADAQSAAVVPATEAAASPHAAPGFDAVPAWSQPAAPIQHEVSPFGGPVQLPSADMSQLAAMPVEVDQPQPDNQEVSFQGTSESDLPTDLQPFSLEAAVSTTPEPTPYAYDQSASIPADSGLPPWSIDPRVPAFDGSSILQLEENASSQSVPAPHGAELTQGAVPFDPGASSNAMGSSPVGPLTGAELPPPTELPGFSGVLGDQSQPWYLQPQEDAGPKPIVESGSHSGYAAAQSEPQKMPEREAPGKASSVTTIECPNCQEQTPDTSMACSNCSFNFFANCPHCHELLDVSDARPGVKEACPQCKADISKMDMGLQGVGVSQGYKSTPLKPGSIGAPIKQSFRRQPGAERGLQIDFGWLVNVVWLVVIIASVWALTQLPTWLRLTGQY
jgi:hypothetical protein